MPFGGDYFSLTFMCVYTVNQLQQVWLLVCLPKGIFQQDSIFHMSEVTQETHYLSAESSAAQKAAIIFLLARGSDFALCPTSDLSDPYLQGKYGTQPRHQSDPHISRKTGRLCHGFSMEKIRPSGSLTSPTTSALLLPT